MGHEHLQRVLRVDRELEPHLPRARAPAAVSRQPSFDKAHGGLPRRNGPGSDRCAAAEASAAHAGQTTPQALDPTCHPHIVRHFEALLLRLRPSPLAQLSSTSTPYVSKHAVIFAR